jgi:hypothetical protein
MDMQKLKWDGAIRGTLVASVLGGGISTMYQASIEDSVMEALLPFSEQSKPRRLCPGTWRILTRSASDGVRTEFRIELFATGSTRECTTDNALRLQVARWQQAGNDSRMEQLASSGLLFVYSGTVVGPKYVQGAFYTPDDANLGGTFVAWRVDRDSDVMDATLSMAIA